jgi:hypothetical protein
MKELFVLYKAGGFKWNKSFIPWNKCGVYQSFEDMIDDLINFYGVTELEGCDNEDIDDIIYEWEFKYEII